MTESRFDDGLIVANADATVVARFIPPPPRVGGAQTEAQLEARFIEQLQSQAYERVRFNNETGLISNLRTQLERLNGIVFSDTEWNRFFTNSIKTSDPNRGVVDKSRRIQHDHVQTLLRDDGSSKNVMLIDKLNIHNNHLQVMNQYAVSPGDGATAANRYDVTILVNGLPLVHVELKRRSGSLRNAFNQINRYQESSFMAGSGLFEYVQLFVVSTGTETKYYANTLRKDHLADVSASRQTGRSNSFQFLSYWADAENTHILDLESFTKTFFAKHAILNILTRYCVFTVEENLLVMRPYQIVGTETILDTIKMAINSGTLGTLAACGWVWHTTGSGKTLTSFKTAQLASLIEGVYKVIFAVDRKDLDAQTMREYNRFQEGAAHSNTSTAVLKKQLEDDEKKIIVTTIQKLSSFVRGNPTHDIYDKNVVIIFDECHRSQFGDMNTMITRKFKKYSMFGFTGTPIFQENSPGVSPTAMAAARRRGEAAAQISTTEQVFGRRLHSYVITNAIGDKNVLKFNVEYNNTVKGGVDATEADLLAPERITFVTEHVLSHFEQRTLRKAGSREGFTSLFASASITAACAYYQEFKKQQADLEPDERRRVAVVFSHATNPDAAGGLLAEEQFEVGDLTGDARAVLDEAVTDFNEMFNTNHSLSSGGFHLYYEDVTQKLKSGELDMVIVVNMLLTGFDAPTLNTLWVDKPLRSHGLIQAFSRTNRILNSVKVAGNIVCFRDLRDATEEAIALFGNKDAIEIVLLQPFQDYFSEYEEKVEEVREKFPIGTLIVSESAQIEFVKLWGRLLRLVNTLNYFDDFQGRDIMSEREKQDYTSRYLSISESFQKEPTSKTEGVEFEIELIQRIQIDVDYILQLIQMHVDSQGDLAKLREDVYRAASASPSLRNKTDLLDGFITEISKTGNLQKPIEELLFDYIQKHRQKELNQLITEENLNPAETRRFFRNAWRSGNMRSLDGVITSILPPSARFNTGRVKVNPGEMLHERKSRVAQKMHEHFARFYELDTEGDQMQ